MSDITNTQTKIYKAMYLDMYSRYAAYTKKHGKEPAIMHTLPNLKGDTIKLAQWNNMRLRFDTWWKKNGKQPNYVVVNPKGAAVSSSSSNSSSSSTSSSKDCYNSKRYLSNANIAQDTNYFCACNIFQQIFYELYGIVIKESEIAAAMGTTKNGTSHQQIINGGKAIAQKYGKKISIEFKNYSDMTETQIGELIESPTKGLFVHDLYKMTWGHYEYLIGLCISSGIYTVANSLSGGYIEKRSRATLKKYIGGISQPSIGIVTKIS